MKKEFIVRLVSILFGIQFFLISPMIMADQPNKISMLKEMFNEVTIKKNDKAIPLYYDQRFELYSNGKKMTYDEFLKMHHDVFKTKIQYSIRYDDAAFLESENKVGARVFITVTKPKEPTREIEVILIAEYKDNKLYRLWELTYPDWSKMKAFQHKSNDTIEK